MANKAATAVRNTIEGIGKALSGLFKKARPGIAQFIKDHGPQAVEVLKTTAREFEGVPLNEWRSRAFSDLSSAINSAREHPDTWVSVLVDLGYDIIKNGKA